MAKYDKKLTTFDVELGGEKVSVDMGAVADLIYSVGKQVNFYIDRDNITISENADKTYLVCVYCESQMTFDHYGSWDANPENNLYKKGNAKLTVLPDGTVVSATLTNLKGPSIYGEQYRPKYSDVHYGLKPEVMNYISTKPQRALLVNLHKIKNSTDLKLFIKFAEHALNNSTIKYKDVVEIKHKLSKKVEKRLEKVEKTEKVKEGSELSK